MPRPASATETNIGAGFGPSQTPGGSIQVVAPLDVQGAPSQAAILARSLGVFNNSAQDSLAREARMRGAADEGSGASASALGNVDPATMAANEGYAVGAQRVSAQKSAIDAIGAIKQQLATDPKLSGLSPSDTVVAADGLLRQKLAGLETDPVSAKAILPLVSTFQNQLFAQKTDQKVQTDISTALNNAGTLAAAEAATPGSGVFNYADHLATIRGLMMGDGVAAQAKLSQDLIDKAVATHNSGILGLITPAPGAPALAPDLQLRIADAQQRIDILQRDDNDKWSKAAQNPIMSSILAGHDPTAQLTQYLAHPGADARFAQEAMGFYHSLANQTTNDQLDTGASAKVIADVAGGTITTAAQALTAVQATGASGKASSQLLDKALQTLRTVQSTDSDDPAMRSAVGYLQQLYRPGQNPLTGTLSNPAQLNQMTGIVLDFRSEYAKAIKNGTSAEEAASQTLQAVTQKWGKPLEQSNGVGTHKSLPLNDTDQVTAIRAATQNPRQFKQSGIGYQDVQRLQTLGLISHDEAEAAAAAATAK